MIFWYITYRQMKRTYNSNSKGRHGMLSDSCTRLCVVVRKELRERIRGVQARNELFSDTVRECLRIGVETLEGK